MRWWRWFRRLCTPPHRHPGSGCGLADLPDDVLRHIAGMLGPADATCLSCASRGLRAAVGEVARRGVRHEARGMLADMERALDAGCMLLTGYQLGPRLGMSRWAKHCTEVPGFTVHLREHVFGEHFLPAAVAGHPYRFVRGEGRVGAGVSTMRLLGSTYIGLAFTAGASSAWCLLHMSDSRLTRVEMHTNTGRGTASFKMACHGFRKKLRRRVGEQLGSGQVRSNTRDM